jgi:hypothetical protein
MEAVIVQVIVAGGVLAALVVMWGLRSSIRPSIIERLERSMVSNQTRLDTQEGEIDDLRRQIVELREGRIADHALLQEWINYARRLATMFTGRGDGQGAAAARTANATTRHRHG